MKSLSLFKYRKEKLILGKKDLLKLTRSTNTIVCVKKCLKITTKCVYTQPAFDYRKIIYPELKTNNIFKFINNYMYGYCHEIVFLMKYLLKINRIKSRIVRLTSKKYGINHWVNEFLYKKKWVIIDPTFGLLFKHKLKNLFLSVEEIKNLNPNYVLPNKKITLKKFSNIERKSFFFYKKKRSFKGAKQKYLSYFATSEFPTLNDKKFSYKKKIIKYHGLNDYMTFKSPNFNERNFKILSTKNKLGIQNGKLVKSNRFIKFRNFIFKKANNSKIVKIKNFPFPILDVRFYSKNVKNSILIEIQSKKFKELIKRKTWLVRGKLKYNIFSRDIRNINIRGSNTIKFYEVLFLSNKYI